MLGFRAAASCAFIILVAQVCSSQILAVYPVSVQLGEEATLSWNTLGRRGYLTSVGIVEGKGSSKLHVKTSETFTLTTDTGHGFDYSVAHLEVNNQRGVEDDFPSLNDFDPPLQTSRAGSDYLGSQNEIWSALQRDGYAVKGDYAPGRPYLVFSTDFVLRPDLVAKTERIRARRLALAITIYEPVNSSMSLEIRPLLEFEYRGESEWHIEHGSPVAKIEAKKRLHLFGSVK